jgi:VCBS repeat-containing protein
LKTYKIQQTTQLSFENSDFINPQIYKINENDFLLKGWINSGSNNYDVFLSKFNLSGQTLWEKVIGGNRNDFINSVTSINDEIYLCGKSLSYDGIFADLYGDGVEWGDEPIKSNWVIKLNASGDIVWNKLLNPSYYQQQNGQFIDIYDGNSFIIVSGSSYNTYDFHENFKNHYNEDVFSVKLDLNGNIIWEKTYGGFNNQVFNSIGFSNDQIIYTTNLVRWNFLGVGGGFSSQGDVTAETNGKFENPNSNNNQNDIWVFATNLDGEIQWNQFYGGENYDRVSFSIYNSDAIYNFASTESSGYDVGELIGLQDSWLFKLAVNETPVAVADNYSLPEDSDLASINVIANDTDTENDTLLLKSINYSGTGTVSINSDDLSIDYTPKPNFYGTETINYTVSDGNTSDSSGVLTIEVTPVNDPPESNDDLIEVNEGGVISILQNNESTLLHNDIDIDEDSLTTIVEQNPSHGLLELKSDGSFTYEHDGSETTSDYFTYKSNDGILDSNISTVSIIINPVNDNSPTDINLTINSVEENKSNVVVGELYTSDIDLPTDSHTFELISGSGDSDNEKFSISGTNLILLTNLDYETEPNLSIRIKVVDQNNNSYEKSLVISVTDINDINITSEVTDSYCSDNYGTGSVTIISINDVSGDSTFSWASANGGIIPSGQENNQNLTNLVAGTYILSLTNGNFNFTQEFEVGVIAQYTDFSLCYVSSDEVKTSNNRIFLNTFGSYNVDYYEVLRETNIANSYESIGTISPSENSFLDESSNNMSQSYSYKVRLMDNCGSYSSNSDSHKTILLQSSISVNNSVNLNWSDYEGKNYQSYDIYRNKNDEGFELIGSVSSNNNSYNDSSADVTQNNYEYYISISVNNCLISSKGKNSAEIKSNLQNVGSSLSVDTLFQMMNYPFILIHQKIKLI